jgi:hypothetical protein
MTIVIKKDAPAEQRMVFGEVYAPDRPDAQGEFMRAEEIQEMAYEFVRKGRMDSIDVMHDNKLVNAHILESFIARKGDPDFIEGAWVIGMHIPDDDLWAAVKKGELNGFSLEALVTRHEQEMEIEIPPVVSGTTSKSDVSAEIAQHEHKFFIAYGEDGAFKGGVTDEVDGHTHMILAGTHTETTLGHSHRFSSVDDLLIN